MSESTWNRPSHDYIGRMRCGCVVAITYDSGDAYTAATIAKWVTMGYTVERVTVEDAVEMHFRYINQRGCDVCRVKPEEGKL